MLRISARDDEAAESRAKREALPPAPAPLEFAFEKFKRAYPKREDDQSWEKARAIFELEIKAGCDPRQVIAAARKLGDSAPLAATWLRQRAWLETESKSG